MFRRNLALIAAGLLAVLAGCSTDTNLGGVAVPNARPDTRVTGQPPTLLEAGFVVTFNWTGSDPDGRVVGYQWKISDNGTDGISVRDTLTHDPLTGAVLNPWHFTTATDSSFVVLADLPNFPPDEEAPRSFRTHSLFIRAVDDKGAVDPSPAYMSFTSTTIVPTAKAVFPKLSTRTHSIAPTTVNMGWSGTDPDFDLRIPTKVRYLWRRALAADGTEISLPYLYNQHYEELIDFDSPDWSTWTRYDPDEANRLVSFQRQPENTYWLFAVQTQDTAGAVSVGRRYGIEVGNMLVQKNGVRPYPTVTETYLGTNHAAINTIDLPAGQPLNYSWSATAEDYNGIIKSYRYGWDLIDVNDQNDPGWAVPPGLTEQHRKAPEKSFDEGAHSFWLVITDDSQQQTIYHQQFSVVPFVDYNLQSELLVVDQVVDDNVQNWPDQSGVARNAEQYRNAYWSFLQSQPGGVSGLDWNLDRIDHRLKPAYRDMVSYKAVLCYAKVNERQLMFGDFRPLNDKDKYVWLIPYQRRGGNFFLVGEGSMDSFLEQKPNYMTPIIFDTREEIYPSGTSTFIVGFGTRELPDGTEQQRGPIQYPFQVAGIAALDWTSVNTKYIYARPNKTMKDERYNDCVGLKALVLDPAFAEHWSVGPGAIVDTMATDPVIDWQDAWFDQQGKLGIITNQFTFRADEFIDANISTTRSTPFAPQACDDPNAPGGMCVEPMFRGIARFDWLRERKWAQGESDWPPYIATALDDTCGSLALTQYSDAVHGDLPRGSARTNGRVYGYLSYKMTADKPSGAPDVFWGFDPYRFDNTQSKKAVRWVLKNVFHLNVLDE